MPLGRSLVAVLLLASTGLGAEVVRTLDGREITGDLVSITEKEIVVRSQGKDTTVPVAQVLQVDAGPAGKLAGTKYVDVELTDGSLLHCSAFGLKDKDALLTLVSGQEVKVPQEVVASYISNAQDDNIQKQWKEIVGRKPKPTSDLVVVYRENELVTLPGTVGKADADGKEILFQPRSMGDFKSIPLSGVHGIIFLRPLDPNLPSTVCTIHDSSTNVVAANAVAVTPTGYTVTTPAGAKIEYTKKLVSRFDYNTGKLRYLSDMKPAKQVVTSTQGDPEPPRPDRNLDGGTLRLGQASYIKGLSVHAYTMLEYDLEGEYREFKCVLGVDGTVGGSEGPTMVKIEAVGADGKNQELFNAAVGRKDPPKDLRFNVKDMQKLRIVVSSPELLDLGKHVDLADAKITK